MERGITRTLDLDKIKKILILFSSSPLGRRKITLLSPSGELSSVERALNLCREMMDYLSAGEEIDLSPAKEIEGFLPLAEIPGSVLEIASFQAIADDVALGKDIRRMFSGMEGRYPLLFSLAGEVPDLSPLHSEIRKRINPKGEVVDTASRELTRIRKGMNRARQRVRRILSGLLSKPEAGKILQEPIITLRNGRFVVPVRAEHKGMVPGVVQDRSASGATLFIEPLPTVELNNELVELDKAEREEVRRILAELTSLVRQHIPALRGLSELLAEFDLILAKARFSLKLDASVPKMVPAGDLILKDARHPLLDKRLFGFIVDAGVAEEVVKSEQDVVPISLTLTPKRNTMVITGPNTGGKTVVLKTVGLLSLMAQSGMPIPASADSQLPLFRSLFADIGDEQSIIQSLSTFSSHIKNIKRMIAKLKQPALVLIDEIGAGTDPSEGAALGIAILEYFHQRGGYNLVTTHHNALKVYAYSKEGMENASVEFDRETLRPTYRLIQGVPGSSNAFIIAEREGFPGEVLRRAAGFLSKDDERVERFIKRMEDELAVIDSEREDIKQKEEELARTKAELEEGLQQVTEEKVKWMRERKKEWEELREKLLNRAEEELSELREKAFARETILTMKSRLSELERRVDDSLKVEVAKKPSSKGAEPTLLKKGDMVMVKEFGREGEVLEDWKRGSGRNIMLLVAGKRMVLPPSQVDVRPSSPAKPRVNVQLVSKNILPELSIRRLTVDEALARVDKFLDNAFLANLREVRIVHGRGTGRLRKAVAEFLETQPYVASYRIGRPEEGGNGVTVVTLDL
jgi:DNA mismatch repair protein MutS2